MSGLGKEEVATKAGCKNDGTATAPSARAR